MVRTFAPRFDPQDSASPTERLVARPYDRVFDRYADAGGAVFWASVLASGASLHDIADVFFTADELTARQVGQDDTASVCLLYRDALDREPEPAGLDCWVCRLASGTSRSEVLFTFFETRLRSSGWNRLVDLSRTRVLEGEQRA